MKILCLDPSIRALGYAVFEVNCGVDRLIIYNVIKLDIEDGNWIERAGVMGEKCRDLFSRYNCDHAYVELPHHYSAGKGEAARNSGAILKLVYLVGYISGRIAHDRVTEIPVQVWKGQVPKEITQKRMLKRWGVTGDHNAIDAVGIGDYVIQKKLYEKVKLPK